MSRLFRCVYEIDIGAEDHLEAAQTCYEYMKTGQAPVINVTPWSQDEHGNNVLPLDSETELVDLDEILDPLVD